MVVAPALLLAVAVAAFHHSNALLFSQAWGSTDPLFRNSFWGFADTSSDFLNLFAVDHPHGELVAGQFEGNFRIFRSTVLLLRLILTMLFACLRLTAVIARTPDEREESESDSAWEEVEEDGESAAPSADSSACHMGAPLGCCWGALWRRPPRAPLGGRGRRGGALPSGRRVLEVGAGVGLVGLLLAADHGMKVTLSETRDGYSGAATTFENLRRNVERFHERRLARAAQADGADGVGAVEFGEAQVMELATWAMEVGVGGVPVPEHSFDLVIGSDVLYEPHLFEDLLDVLQTAAPKAVLVQNLARKGQETQCSSKGLNQLIGYQKRPGRLARLGRFERFAPENFRIHFLASSHGTDRAWQVSEVDGLKGAVWVLRIQPFVLSVFQQISAAAKRQLPTFCCSAGRCESPPGDVDLLVCMDETSAAERAEEVQLGEICCLADFLDACPIEEQLTQLDHLVEMDRVHWHSLQPELLARVRSLVDWDEDPEDLLQTAQALAAAGEQTV
eukprot:g32238.t1